jgi:P-type Mg2+ transporter
MALLTKAPVATPLEISSTISDFGVGLSSQVARAKLLEFGPNELSSSKPRPVVLQLLGYFTQPLMAILLIAAVISGISGDWLNASIIVLIVVGSIALDFVQTRRSQVAAEGLRVQVAPTAMVKRDGAWLEVARGNLVPGDVIRLSAGALVPADARLLSASDLHVQQSALTGESMPVEKMLAHPDNLPQTSRIPPTPTIWSSSARA